MRFVQGHGQALDRRRPSPEFARRDPGSDAVEDGTGQHLGRGVPSGEGRFLVQVAVVQLTHHRLQRGRGQADIDDDAVLVQLRPAEGQVDDIGGAVQLLRRAEHGAAEAVGDHEMVADRNRVHA
jgi:hypothetical protein